MAASTRKRLPHSAATKAKIAKALLGRKRPAGVKAAIAATLTGRKHTEAAKAKMRAAHATRPPLDTAARAVTKARHAARSAAVKEQWRKDLRAALRLGAALFEDVKASNGWKSRRKVFDPSKTVSDGALPYYRRKPKFVYAQCTWNCYDG